MLKILQARLLQYVNQELPDVQAGFRKGRGTRDQIANICWIMKKARELQKNICFTDYAKAFDLWITTNCGKFLKRWEYQTTVPASWDLYAGQEATVRTRHGTTDWFQIGDKVRQGLHIVTLLIEFICRVHHEKPWTGRNTSWNQDWWEKYQ